MLRHPDVFEQFARERLANLRLEAQQDRLTRLAEGTRPAAGFILGRFLGRVRVRLSAPRGAAAELDRTAHPSGA